MVLVASMGFATVAPNLVWDSRVIVANASTSDLAISEQSGWLESAYAEFKGVSGAVGYKAYVKQANQADSAYTQIDDTLIRQYASNWRVDAVGLKAGSYVIKVEAVMKDGSKVTATTQNLNVSAYDRSGFAFSKNSQYGSGSGAYNDDGTLKSGAQVVYVTPETAKTCTATVGGTTVTGFQSILDEKQKTGDTAPIDFRIVGCVTLNDLDHISSSAEGIQIKGKKAYGEMNITIEGIGEDATVSGFGFLVRNAGNVEFRNLGVMNFLDDGISLDTKNCNIWVHNCDLFYGSVGGDADQAKGDGSIDVKGASTNVTLSYNHFWDSGKCSLCGMSDSAEFLVTYHHNWFDHSDSRHARIRVASVHLYNNYYDGNAKYGVGTTKGSSAFVEANYFRNCKNPMMSSLQGTDARAEAGTFSGENGGMIKAYANEIVGAKSVVYANSNAGSEAADSTSFDAYLVSNRSDTVPSSYKTLAGGTTYNNFDTSSSYDLGVSAANVDKASDVPAKVTTYAGRVNGGDFKWTFTDEDDQLYAVNTALKSALVNYKSSVVAIGGYKGVVGAGSGNDQPSTQATTKATTAATTKATTASSTTKATAATTKATTAATTKATTATSTSTSKYMFNPSKGLSNSYFTVAGSIVTDKGTASVNGSTISSAVKFDSKGSLKFKTSSDKAKLTLYVKAKADGAYLTLNSNKVSGITTSVQAITIDLAKAGDYSLVKGSGECYLFYAIVEEGSSTAATTKATTKAAETKTVENVLNVSETGTISEFFDVTGNTTSKAGSVSYNGLTLKRAIKLESSTQIKFATSSDNATLTIVLNSANSKDVKIDGKVVTADSNGVVTKTLSKGSHIINKANTGNLYYISLKETSEVTSPAKTDDSSTSTSMSEGDIYVSPAGTSTGKGTEVSPMDLVTAINTVKPGNTIYMASGTYQVYKTYGAPIVIAEDNSGSEGKYKTIRPVAGGDVTLDFAGMTEEGSNRGVVLDGSYWYFYNIDITNAGDNGMLLSGDHNKLELCQFYGNHDSGLQISRYNTNYSDISQWPSYNLIKNCTAFNNKDDATCENADGFAAKLTCGEGNVFDGCMSYCNSDDGWDLYAKPATGSIGVVTIKNCVAFGNGKLTNGEGSANGDMNGFKLGGSNGACPTPHVVENCLAFNNGATGFTDNGNGGAIKMSNCLAANNGLYDSQKANFMCYRTSQDATFKNLVSYNSSSNKASDKFKGTLTNCSYFYKGLATNYYCNSLTLSGTAVKYTGSEANSKPITAADFVSVTVPGYNNGAYATNYHEIFRNADGSINMNGLFQIASSSKLAGMGADL